MKMKTENFNAAYDAFHTLKTAVFASKRADVCEVFYSAAENAYDTLIDESTTRSEEYKTLGRHGYWYQMFNASLSGVLAFRETSSYARKWYAKRGIIG